MSSMVLYYRTHTSKWGWGGRPLRGTYRQRGKVMQVRLCDSLRPVSPSWNSRGLCYNRLRPFSRRTRTQCQPLLDCNRIPVAAIV